MILIGQFFADGSPICSFLSIYRNKIFAFNLPLIQFFNLFIFLGVTGSK